METDGELREYMMKEIDTIQNIIKRMAQNSFMIKGWTITLVVASLLLKGSRYQGAVAAIPLLMFWVLDAYFLWQERMYRKLFEWVVNNRLRTRDYLFDMNTCRFKKNVQPIYRIMFSTTLGLFYGSIAVLTVTYVLVMLRLTRGWC